MKSRSSWAQFSRAPSIDIQHAVTRGDTRLRTLTDGKPPRGARRLEKLSFGSTPHPGGPTAPFPHHAILIDRYTDRMLRATRSGDTGNVLALLHQYAAYSRVLLTSRRLEHQIEETLDDLYDLGFNGQLLSNHLTATLQELRHFITRCDHAIRTLEQRIIHLCTR